MRAVQYLILMGVKESLATLQAIYKSSSDVEVKRAILHSLAVTGGRGRMLEVAKTEQSPELRAEAVQQLGLMGARTELFQLYQNEASTETKETILQAMFVGGDIEHTVQVARSEKQPGLRRIAVRNLGYMPKENTAGVLVTLYNSEKEPAIKRAVMQALLQQGDAKPLIQIARQEKNIVLKKEAVQELSQMHSKDSNEFMLELLNKP